MTKQGDATRARLAKRLANKLSTVPAIETPKPEVLVADGRVWIKVPTPKLWRPVAPGEVLIGELVARGTKVAANGGVYGVVTLKTDRGSMMISGVVITSLFDAADCDPGAIVRVVFRGEHVSAEGRTYKDYDLFLVKGGS